MVPFCDRSCHGFLFPHSAAGNLQLYLPMRVVRLACQPHLPFRTIAAAMIYTGESYDNLLQACETNCVVPYTSTRCQPRGFLLALIFRRLKRSPGCEPKLRKLMNRASEKFEAGTQPNSWQGPAATSHHWNYFEDSGCCFWSILLLATACNYGEGHRNTYMPLVHAHTVRVHWCKAFLSGKKGTISHDRKWQVPMSENQRFQPRVCSQHVRAMHREIGSVPRPDWTRTWFVVDALHHQSMCKMRRKRIHTKCVVKHPLGAGLRYNVIALSQDERRNRS